MAVPANLLLALNGLAAAAKTANDPSTISLLTQIYQLSDYGMPAAVYQNAVTSTTNYWTQGSFYAPADYAPTEDTGTGQGAPTAPGAPGTGFAF
jgi:hypothetical protein